MAYTSRRAFSIGRHDSCQSDRGHDLDLDPMCRDFNGLPLLRITFTWHQNEQKMRHFMNEKVVEIAKAMKPSSHAVRAPYTQYSIGRYQNTPNLGGGTMGADPATSVLNKYKQS